MSPKPITVPIALFSLAAVVLGIEQIGAGIGEITGSSVPPASQVRSIAMDARADMKTFVHEGLGIALSYPRPWRRVEDEEEPLLLTLRAQHGVVSYSFLSEEAGSGASLERYVERDLDEFQGAEASEPPGVEVFSRRYLEVGAAPAIEVRMRVDVPEVPFEVTIRQTYILSGDRAYVITLTAATSVIEELDGLTGDILGSIEFLRRCGPGERWRPLRPTSTVDEPRKSALQRFFRPLRRRSGRESPRSSLPCPPPLHA